MTDRTPVLTVIEGAGGPLGEEEEAEMMLMDYAVEHIEDLISNLQHRFELEPHEAANQLILAIVVYMDDSDHSMPPKDCEPLRALMEISEATQREAAEASE